MSCEDKRYIIVPLQGIPGPAGPQGPPGPPGAGVQLPIAASDVSVTNPGFANAQEIFDFLLYTPIAINSFTTPIDVYEIGQSVNSLTFNWILNKDPQTQSLTGPNIIPPTLVPTDRTSTLAVAPPIAGVSPGDSFTYQLSVTDETALTVNRNEVVSFLNGVYYGDADIPGVIDSNFILSLASNLQSGRGRTFTSNATGSQHAWYCHRSALGNASFQVGLFVGGFEPPVVVSFTNASGFTENYNVYRSTNPGIGPVNITAS